MLHLWIGIIRIILANVPAAARGLEDLGGRGDVRVPSVRAVNVDRRDIRECRDRKEKEVQPVRRENKVFREDRDLQVLKALLAHRVFPARQALRGYKGLSGQQDQQGITDRREFLAKPVQWEIQARRVLKAIQGLSVYPAQRVLPVLRVFRDRWAILE